MTASYLAHFPRLNNFRRSAYFRRSPPGVWLDKSVAIAPRYGGYGFTSVILFIGSMLTAAGMGGLFSMFLRARLVRD